MCALFVGLVKMTKEKRVCKNKKCSKSFIAKVYNSIYCSSECRRIVTNDKLLKAYHDKKKNKNKPRVCATKTCTTVLSTYNKENICELCKQKRFVKRLAGWGWDEDKLNEELNS